MHAWAVTGYGAKLTATLADFAHSWIGDVELSSHGTHAALASLAPLELAVALLIEVLLAAAGNEAKNSGGQQAQEPA